MNQRTLSVLVENEFGVLARVASMFAARGYNIDSLSVAPSIDPKYSLMTIVTHGSEEIIEQIQKQLYRLIDTIQVKDLSSYDCIERELVLVKVNAHSQGEETIDQKTLSLIAEKFSAKCIDQSARSKTFELCAEPKIIMDFLENLNCVGIIEVIRSGVVAIQKGDL